MSSPDVNIEKQKKRHKGPLIGIVAVLVFAGIMALVWAGGDDLTEDDAQDGAAEIEATIEDDG